MIGPPANTQAATEGYCQVLHPAGSVYDMAPERSDSLAAPRHRLQRRLLFAGAVVGGVGILVGASGYRAVRNYVEWLNATQSH